MALKTEKLSDDVLESIKNFQSDISSNIFTLGQISYKKRELNKELSNLQELKNKLEEVIDNKSMQLDNLLSDLQKKYKNADIDLEAGTVVYEVSE